MSQTIRFCTPEDLPVVADIGKLFFEEGKLPGKLIPDVFVRTWTSFLASGTGGILLLENDGLPIGMLGFLKYPDINDGETVMSETFWYVKPDQRGGGIRLLRKFEETAREQGAKRVMMAHLKSLMPEELAHLYVRRGYQPTETNYLKVLSP
jgi:GNAT superfamily N-acetyltransferase